MKMKDSGLNRFLRKAENVIGGCLFFVMMVFTGMPDFIREAKIFIFAMNLIR